MIKIFSILQGYFMKKLLGIIVVLITCEQALAMNNDDGRKTIAKRRNLLSVVHDIKLIIPKNENNLKYFCRS